MSGWHPGQLPRGRGQVRLEGYGPIAELVLDNPSARNAISPGMMVDLERHLDTLEGSETLGLLVRGEGGAAFCAGGDLGAVAEHLLEPGAGAGMCAFMTAQLDRLSRLPMVVVAAVEGAALGGGAELLTAVDVVIASEAARIGFVQASLGVSPGWGGGARLVRRVGVHRAVQWLGLAQLHPAAEAVALGLVNRLSPPGEAVRAARALLAPLESLPVEAVRASISVARGTAGPEEEQRLFAGLWGGPAHVEALARLGRSRR